jgi:hypothetical protein
MPRFFYYFDERGSRYREDGHIPPGEGSHASHENSGGAA